MAFQRKTWTARQGTGLNKYTDLNTEQVMELLNTPDSVTVQGDAFTAANMNNLETRIYNGFNSLPTGVGPWQNLTLQTGFTAEYARWRTIDFGANAQIQLKNIQGPTSLSFPANICKLPDEALPANTTYRGISCGTGSNYSRYEISPWNGYVQWYSETPSYGSGHWIDIQCVYPIT
ncbi:MAG: hypothetical protein HPZ00_06315 [Christensenellaceae bacterium]|nr:hypothetical protein [Christensenellaceae bacterium]DAS00368.1 MAG TPA: hypothetical protein [Bacteriophage sp.]